MKTIIERQPCFLSHDFDFLNKPIMYGAACLLYGAATSDSVDMNKKFYSTSIQLIVSEYFRYDCKTLLK